MTRTIFSQIRSSLAKLIDASLNGRAISIPHGKNVRSVALMAAVGFMVLVASACKPAAPEVIPDGEYSISEDHGYGTGTITMVLDQGHFSVSTPGYGELVSGSYAIAEDKITFQEEVISAKEKAMCANDVTYSYLWTYDAKEGELYFNPDLDECELRWFTNTGGNAHRPWQLKTKEDG